MQTSLPIKHFSHLFNRLLAAYRFEPSLRGPCLVGWFALTNHPQMQKHILSIADQDQDFKASAATFSEG
jgi:hypothetical protein